MLQLSGFAHAHFVLLLHLLLLFPLDLHLALSLLVYHLLPGVVATQRRPITDRRLLRTVVHPKSVIVTDAFYRFSRHIGRKWNRGS